MTTLLADPAKMIAKGARRVIHNEQELEAYTNALFRLTALENPSHAEQEAIEPLTLLIERYEETSYPIPRQTRFPLSVFFSNIKTSHSRNSDRRVQSPCSSRVNGSSPWSKYEN